MPVARKSFPSFLMLCGELPKEEGKQKYGGQKNIQTSGVFYCGTFQGRTSSHYTIFTLQTWQNMVQLLIRE